MKVISLALVLLLSSNNANATSEPSSNPTGSNASDAPVPLAPVAETDNKQTVVSTCRAMRKVMDHNGGIAQWKAKCRVEVWAGTEQPEFKDLTEEQKAQIHGAAMPNAEDKPQPGAVESENEIMDKGKHLEDEAKLRHFMCMEARKSILSSLKSQLPTGLTSKDQVMEAMKTLNLSPELEAFMSKIDANMKKSLAAIHAIQQHTQLPESERQESLRTETTKLTGLIDEQCKDDHPTIRYHDVGYLPHPDLEKVHMTLLISRPGKRLEFFNLPESAYARHVEYLRNMVEAAAHHSQVTGEKGEFEVLHHPLPDPIEQENSRLMGGFDDSHPAVISVLRPKDGSGGEGFSVPSASSASVGINSSSASIESAAPSKQIDTIVPVVEKSPISEYWSDVFAAETEYQTAMKALSDPKVSKAEVQVKSKDASKRFNDQIIDMTRKLTSPENIASKKAEYGRSTSSFWGKSYDKLSVEQKEIEDRYQKSKTLLKEAIDYAKHKKTVMEILKRVQSLPDKVYAIGKEALQDIREHEKQQLKPPVPATAAAVITTPSPQQQQQQQSESLQVVALPVPAEENLSPTKAVIDIFVNQIGEANKLKDKARADAINAAVKELLKEDNIDLIPESPEKYEPSTKNYWKKTYNNLEVDEKAIELPYQKKKELLTEAEKALPLVKGKFLWSSTLSKEVYNSGKAIIDMERLAKKKEKDSAGKTVGSKWSFFQKDRK